MRSLTLGLFFKVLDLFSFNSVFIKCKIKLSWPSSVMMSVYFNIFSRYLYIMKDFFQGLINSRVCYGPVLDSPNTWCYVEITDQHSTFISDNIYMAHIYIYLVNETVGKRPVNVEWLFLCLKHELVAVAVMKKADYPCYTGWVVRTMLLDEAPVVGRSLVPNKQLSHNHTLTEPVLCRQVMWRANW